MQEFPRHQHLALHDRARCAQRAATTSMSHLAPTSSRTSTRPDGARSRWCACCTVGLCDFMRDRSFERACARAQTAPVLRARRAARAGEVARRDRAAVAHGDSNPPWGLPCLRHRRSPCGGRLPIDRLIPREQACWNCSRPALIAGEPETFARIMIIGIATSIPKPRTVDNVARVPVGSSLPDTSPHIHEIEDDRAAVPGTPSSARPGVDRLRGRASAPRPRWRPGVDVVIITWVSPRCRIMPVSIANGATRQHVAADGLVSTIGCRYRPARTGNRYRRRGACDFDTIATLCQRGRRQPSIWRGSGEPIAASSTRSRAAASCEIPL